MRYPVLAAAAAACLAAVAAIGSAFAETAPLSEKKVAAFVAALDDVDAFAARMEQEGKMAALQADTEPKPGEPFRPYANAIAALKQVGEYDAFAKIVKANGFKSPEEWAAVGDPVIAAAVNLQMEAEDPEGAAKISQMEIPPELLNNPNIPPAMLEQMKSQLSMVQTFADAPAQHKDAVRPHMPALTAWMERNEAKAGAAP